jgi:type I restriction enzyme, S subunit
MPSKPYPRYKPSGIEWLGDVPEHWEVKRLKEVVRRNDRKLEATEDEPLPYIGLENISSWTGKKITIDEEQTPVGLSNFFTSGNILFGKLRPYLAKAYIAETDGLCSAELLVFETKKEEKRYVLYQLLSVGFISIVNASTFGVKMPRASWDFIGIQGFILPPLLEQQAIADYLDTKTKILDELTAKKRTLLEKLQEQRTAIISRAVTKGLPEAEARAAGVQVVERLKPSGIEWLGDVPEHWEVKRLDMLATVKARLGWKALKAEEYVDEGYIFLATPNIKGEGEIDFQNVNFITQERFLESPEIMLNVNDVLLAKDGSTLGITNLVRHLPAPATVNSSIAVIRSNGLLESGFLFRWLTSSFMTGLISSLKGGQGVPHLFQADIKKFPILLPPLLEQQAIAAYLDRETARIDHLIQRVEAALEKLSEYRAALITAAVTGRIDVRQEENP